MKGDKKKQREIGIYLVLHFILLGTLISIIATYIWPDNNPDNDPLCEIKRIKICPKAFGDRDPSFEEFWAFINFIDSLQEPHRVSVEPKPL